MRLGSRGERDLDRLPVPLQNATRGTDDHHMRQIGHAFVVIKSLLREQRRTLRDVDQRRSRSTAREAKMQVTVLSDNAGRHLRRLVLIRREFRRIVECAHAPDIVSRRRVQFMNIRTCALTWMAARISFIGANPAMSSSVALADLL